MALTLLRNTAPEDRHVFVVMPYGLKHLSDGQEFDFDNFYRRSLKPTIEDKCKLVANRADDIYGPNMVMDVVWQGLQQAEIVIVDFSARAANVALEFGMALLLGERIIVLAQDLSDVPSDVKGLYRVITYTSDYYAVQEMEGNLVNQIDQVRRNQVTEMALVPFGPNPSTRHVPGEVIDVQETYVVIQSRDGHHGILRNDDVTYKKVIPDMRKNFHIGERVEGAFVLDPDGGTKYTLLAGQPNPWPPVATSHPKGHRFVGKVHSIVEKTGVFVRVAHGLNGLIPARTLTSTTLLSPEQEVEVEVSEIDVEKRKITLELADMGPYDIADRVTGEVARVNSDRGYILVALPGMMKTAILPASNMSGDLAQRTSNGEVEVGTELYVEIDRIDKERLRMVLRELPERFDQEAEEP